MRGALGERRFEADFPPWLVDGASGSRVAAFALREPIEEPAGGPGTILTKRERQVADLIARGLTNRQIAINLVISQRTVQGHVEHILTKLGFNSRTQIAASVVESADSLEQL
ncbi:response regulator transcription factor [Nocardia niigatensis]